MSVTALRVAVRQGLVMTIVKVYPLLEVVTLSSRVDVTVKAVDVPWSETSDELIVTTRLEIDIQDSDGVEVSVSVWLQPAS